MARAKNTGRVTAPAVKKQVATPPAPRMRNLRLRFDRLDLGSEWCLSAITNEDHADLLKKLGEWESHDVVELFNGHPGKDYKLSDKKVPKHLLHRLRQIGSDDLDTISRLRITGARRLYGIRSGNEFSVLWWDPTHAIWPSSK